MKLILNTKDRESFSTVGNPSWIMNPPIEEFTQLKISKMIIPNVLYSFSKTNNYITINNITVRFSSDKTHSSISECLTDMNSHISIAIAVGKIPNVSSFVLSFIQNQGILQATYTSTVPINITANKRLGIPNDIQNLPAGTAATYKFEHNFSTLNTKAVYVATQNISTRDVRTSLLYGNIIACCPLNQGYGGICIMEDFDESSYLTMEGSGDSWSKIELFIYDGNGDLIDMRGEDVIIEMLLKK